MYATSIISLFACTYNAHAHIMPIAVDPLPLGEILRVAFIWVSWQKHMAIFDGGMITRMYTFVLKLL